MIMNKKNDKKKKKKKTGSMWTYFNATFVT